MIWNLFLGWLIERDEKIVLHAAFVSTSKSASSKNEIAAFS